MNQTTDQYTISHFYEMPNRDSAAMATKTERVVITGINELSKYITTVNGWSAAVFKGNYRNKANFEVTQLIAIDIDKGCTLDEAKELFKTYKCVIATTRNHQKIKAENPACDRFRVIFPLSTPITNSDIYRNTWNSLYQQYPFIDDSCSNTDRMWFGSTDIIVVNEDGKTIDPVLTSTPKTPAKPNKPNIKKAATLAAQTAKAFFPTQPAKMSQTTYDLIHNAKYSTNSRHLAFVNATTELMKNGFQPDEILEQLTPSFQELGPDKPADELAKIVDWATKNVEPTPPEANFPDLFHNPKSDKWEPVANSPDNMKFLIQKVVGLTCSFNQLLNKVEANNELVTDFLVSKISMAARYAKISPNKDFIIDTLNILSDQNSYHPFKQAVESVVWDGQDYIAALFNTIQIEQNDDGTDALYPEYLRRWLIGVIAKVYKPGSQNLVLTLKGGQGLGKSRWLSKFEIAKDTYSEGHINPENKDHILYHTSKIIFHAAELDGITKKAETSALKDFFTKETISVREAYGRFATTGKSVLSFVASVNSDQFLKDETGNRRFLVLPITGINPNHNVDMLQVFAQAKVLFEQGEKWWFDLEEIQLINAVNENYMAQTRVDLFAAKVKPGNEWLSAMEIFEMSDRNYQFNAGSLKRLGVLLSKKGIKSKRIVKDGVKRTVYAVASIYADLSSTPPWEKSTLTPN